MSEEEFATIEARAGGVTDPYVETAQWEWLLMSDRKKLVEEVRRLRGVLDSVDNHRCAKCDGPAVAMVSCLRCDP